MPRDTVSPDKRRIQDAEGDVLSMDDVSGGLQITDALRHEIHESNAFSFGHIFEDVASSASAEIYIATGSTKYAHIRFEGAAEADAFMYMLEGTSVTGDGTTITAHNRDRGSTLEAELTVCHTPTVDDDGSTILAEVLPGGVKGFASDEFILDADQTYLLRVTNKGTETKNISINGIFYEQPV